MELPRPEMDVQEAILARRSVRSYTEQAVDPATVRTLLEAAVRAPTAMHEEAWTFVVVQDRQLLHRLSDRAKPLFAAQMQAAAAARPGHGLGIFAQQEFNIFYDAGTLIVICARPLGPFAAADCWLAAENLMLTACALGLGSCVIGSALPGLNTPETKAELGIPVEQTAVAPIIVGHPRDEAPPTARRTPQVLAWR